ncbi:MAG: glycoside hydrolase family 78 protein [Spirochaetaceae bacterium]|jgi:alpha-L-rhamnosidase|nr:glycoside hydrolase family 78 protein [Spirochaetaceae bacterium]
MTIHRPPRGLACWEGCHFIGNPLIDEMAAPFFRKRIALPDEVVSAEAYLCGVGYHELYINGVKAGNSFLTPAQSHYDRTVYYNTYDIGALLVKGENTFCVILGNGLYNCNIKPWHFDKAPWRDRPKMLFLGDILLRDRRICCCSDSSFETGESGITYNSYYGGETQDYTRGDILTGGPDPAVQKAVIVKSPGGVLTPFPEPYVTEQLSFTPLKRTILDGNTTLFDFGQNMTGWAHVDAQAPVRTRISLRYGEKLNAAGGLDTSHIASYIADDRFQTDEYILDADHPVRDGRPHFTYHGFRYIEVSVREGRLDQCDLRALTLNSDLRRIGNFGSSDDYVNRIFEIGQRASLSNLVNVPTDCPHREKHGWTGDAAVSAEQMCLNLDMKAFFRRWLHDLRDAQRPSGQIPGIVPTSGWGYGWSSGPVWDSALFELPMAVYSCYGDDSLLLENRDAMKRYLDFCGSMATDHIVDFGLGDWCPPQGNEDEHRCPVAVTDTATYFKMTGIMAFVSELAGVPADREYYQTLSSRIKESFNRNFVNSETGLVAGNRQTGQGIAVTLGLLDGDTKMKAVRQLRAMIENNNRYHDFGILGVKYVLDALSLNGEGQLAMDIILRKGFPGYCHWIDEGATTMAEKWSRISSDNHHMFSDVCRWFYRYVAGLGKPDFHNCVITFTPDFPAPLTRAEAFTESAAGKFSCRWEKQAGDVVFTCTVPRNFSVKLLPSGYGLPVEASKEVRTGDSLTVNFFLTVNKYN